MHKRFLTVALGLALAAGACSDDTKGPTAPANETSPVNETPSFAKGGPTRTGPLVEAFTSAVTNATGQTGTFTGTVSITSFATNAAGDLLASGTIVGSVTGGFTQAVNQTFTNALVIPNNACTILSLDLGPIFLNLLGLVVQTNLIEIDIFALPGSGNLLGNLLCALVGLLDQNPLAAAITDLLNQINAILAGL